MFLEGNMEPSVRYHFVRARSLTSDRDPVEEPYQVGSLTGAVAS